MNKNPLIASFIFPERLDWFLNYLNEKFKISKEKVFGFKILDDESKIMVTFKFKNTEDRRINFRKLFPDAIQIHKKGTCIYTINALNKLIEETSEMEIGNINYKSVKINWNNYQDKLIIQKNGNLFLYDIKRIF